MIETHIEDGVTYSGEIEISDGVARVTLLPKWKNDREQGLKIERVRSANGYSYEIFWRNGRMHRVGGPAFTEINENGRYELWYYDGKLNRTDGGPSLSMANGMIRMWHRDGKLNRTDGPAVMFASPDEPNAWYEDGRFIREEEKQAPCAP